METIADKKKDFERLMKDGFFEKNCVDASYRFTLKDGQVIYSAIQEDGTLYQLNTVSLDEYKNALYKRIYFAQFIEELFKSVGIEIGSIESDYYVLTEYCSRIYGKKEGDTYIFIELLIHPIMKQALRLNLVKFNMNTRDLSFDRIDLKELKHYHTDSKISEYTYNEFKKHEAREHWYLSHNDLYDVLAEEVPRNKTGCAYAAMEEYGELVGDFDADKLDKNFCKVIKYKKPDGSYANEVYYTQETKC